MIYNFLIGILLILISPAFLSGQKTREMQSTGYHEIPPYPDKYNEFTTVARMIDGLGYRYFWATEGLTENETMFAPDEQSRSIRETMDHIYGLSKNILYSCKSMPVERTEEFLELDVKDLRNATLEMLSEASITLKQMEDSEMNDLKIRFKRGELVSEFPFWNVINGPLADAIYHVGQIVSFRRTAGNPLDPDVNVFTGKNKE